MRDRSEQLGDALVVVARGDQVVSEAVDVGVAQQVHGRTLEVHPDVPRGHLPRDTPDGVAGRWPLGDGVRR